MNKYFFSFVLALFSCIAQAEIIYVTDSWRFTLRSQESNRSKIIKMLAPGTPLTVLSQNKNSGYTKVKLKDGTVGFILTSHTKTTPIYRWQLKQANKQLDALKQQFSQVKAENTALKDNTSKTELMSTSLTNERDQLKTELDELKHTATNAVQLKQERDQLHERVVIAERELQQIKREKQALQDTRNQDWFLYGGILSFVGIFLGLLLPKISWHRKTSNWDTF